MDRCSGRRQVTVSLALLLSGAVSRVERMLLPWRHDLRP